MRYGVGLHGVHQDHTVYPGHPVTVAYEIMLVFENDVEKALAPSFDKDGRPLGWCNALSESGVCGGGSSVREGCDLLDHVRSGLMTPEEAVAWGDGAWERRTWIGGDHREAFEPGQIQADKYKELLLERLHLVTPKKE